MKPIASPTLDPKSGTFPAAHFPRTPGTYAAAHAFVAHPGPAVRDLVRRARAGRVAPDRDHSARPVGELARARFPRAPTALPAPARLPEALVQAADRHDLRPRLRPPLRRRTGRQGLLLPRR